MKDKRQRPTFLPMSLEQMTAYMVSYEAWRQGPFRIYSQKYVIIKLIWLNITLIIIFFSNLCPSLLTNNLQAAANLLPMQSMLYSNNSQSQSKSPDVNK